MEKVTLAGGSREFICEMQKQQEVLKYGLGGDAKAIARGRHCSVSMPPAPARATLPSAEPYHAALVVFIVKVFLGAASDAYHLTTPTEDGVGAFLSMQRCLRDSDSEPKQLSYVNAHATSTPLGDYSEARAIARLLPAVAVSSIKGFSV